MQFFNLARMTVASTGTGDLTLGGAVTGFLTFDLAGCSTAAAGQIIRYAINDNTNSEIGLATYISSSLLLHNRTPEASTNAGATIAVSNAAQVFITPSAADWQTYTGVIVYSSAMALTSSQQALACNNAGAVSYSSAQALSSAQYAQALANLRAVSYSSLATALTSAQYAQALTNITAVSYSSQATALTPAQQAQALTNLSAVSYSSQATALTSAQQAQALTNLSAVSYSSQAAALSAGQQAQAVTNISAVSYSSQATALSSAQFAQALTNIKAVSYSSQATALTSAQQAQAQANIGLVSSTYLLSSNNLSDLPNRATAIANLSSGIVAGAVGTYGLLWGSSANPGDLVAGSLLLWSDTLRNTSSAPTGTWQQMGFTNSFNETSLWERVA